MTRCVDVFEPGLELGGVGREGEERGEVAAGRAAGHDDEVGIAPVLGDVLSDPAERELAVDELIGNRHARAEPVVGGHTHPALGGEVQHEREGLLALVADHPGAAVQLEEDRGAVHAALGPPDVEQVTPAAARRVLDVLDALDSTVAQIEGEEQVSS